MLHAIGRKQRSDDLVGLLLDCHQRIRTFAGLAVAVSERMDALPGEVVEVCRRVERYFSEALPLHVQDEEESILPRLHGRSHDIDVALERMREQHDRHLDLLRGLLELSAAVRMAPGDEAVRWMLHDVALELQADFEPHLQAEERIIFPAIRSLVSTKEQQDIVGELRARRQSTVMSSRLP